MGNSGQKQNVNDHVNLPPNDPEHAKVARYCDPRSVKCEERLRFDGATLALKRPASWSFAKIEGEESAEMEFGANSNGICVAFGHIKLVRLPEQTTLESFLEAQSLPQPSSVVDVQDVEETFVLENECKTFIVRNRVEELTMKYYYATVKTLSFLLGVHIKFKADGGFWSKTYPLFQNILQSMDIS